MEARVLADRADLDDVAAALRGFLGLSDDVKRGYKNIRVKYRVKTDAENMAKLEEFSKLSPVFDTAANGTNVDVQIERK